MLVKPKTTGQGKVVRFKRRQVRRNKRRPLEAVDHDWEVWDAAAERMGINWSEFCRRAQSAFVATQPPELALDIVRRRHSVSEKGGVKNNAVKRTKATSTRAGRKG